MTEKYSMKDDLFNQGTLEPLALSLYKVYSDFDYKGFLRTLVNQFKDLELKERISAICKGLYDYLPNEYMTTTTILLNSVKENGLLNKEMNTDTPESGSSFVYAAYSEYVETYGCTKDYLDYSLNLLGEFTKVLSAEFAIRRFINTFPDETYLKMLEWSTSDNIHQRRLASEGLRPKLPWASSITFNIETGLQPLNNLYYDSNRYVTRSVANHLNDISKLNPDLVLHTLNQWKLSGKQDNREMEYIINHALRTLIKKGHKETLHFLGYHSSPNIKLLALTPSSTDLTIGDALHFELTLKAYQDEQLIIDYIITYASPNRRHSTKVFKLKKVTMVKDETLTLKKKHPFKIMTTKKLYPGKHQLTLQINGKQLDSFNFSLYE